MGFHDPVILPNPTVRIPLNRVDMVGRSLTISDGEEGPVVTGTLSCDRGAHSIELQLSADQVQSLHSILGQWLSSKAESSFRWDEQKVISSRRALEFLDQTSADLFMTKCVLLTQKALNAHGHEYALWFAQNGLKNARMRAMGERWEKVIAALKEVV